ncbi:hypothetical protein [Empedobacter sedimenti]|uniref:hypothetical protein n=1 Tax=Empedobacter sedimenti TaxID=3042610 RepID=UPI0024A6AF05|nr:hypothetical protein [Empedobacter sedimenti]
MDHKIFTTYNNITTDNKRIVINFDLISADKIYIEFALNTQNKNIIWEIYEDNIQNDRNDLTKGSKAELIVLKSYSGSPQYPNVFNIIAKSDKGDIIAFVDLVLIATPKINEGKWVDNNEKEIYNTSFNHQFTVSYKGYGIYNNNLSLKLYLLNPTGGEDENIEERITKMVSLYDLETFYLDFDLLKDSKMFVAKSQVLLFRENIDRLLKIQSTVSGERYKVGSIYFTLSHDGHIIYNGKLQKKFLEVNFSLIDIQMNEIEEISINPVVVSDIEQYFTQKYEPCKYEKITYQLGSNKPIELFNEKKPTTKSKDKEYLNNKLQLAIIAPPKNSKNIQRLNIKLDKVSTKECNYEQENKKLINFSSEELENKAQPHKGQVIILDRLKEANIKADIIKVDEEANIYPSFNYLYNKNSAWDFLLYYFLFSSMINERDATILNRGDLMDWEIESKGLIQLFRIPLNTCRYSKLIKLKLYADVAWATHIFYDDPNEKKFYMDHEVKESDMRKGLDSYLDALMNSTLLTSFNMPVGNPFYNNMIRYFIIELIKDMANKYEIGFSAFYDFDNEGKTPAQEIHYAKQYALLFDALIAGVVTLEILIQVLLIVLTEGASAELILAKLAPKLKAGTKIAKLANNSAARVAKNPSYYSYMSYSKMAYTKFTLPKLSYYKGYRFVEGKNIGIEPMIEENVNFSPLLDLGIKTEKTLAEWLAEKTPPVKVIDLTKQALKFLSITANAFFFSNKSIKQLKKIDTKSTEASKEIVGYTLDVINKSLDTVREFIISSTELAVKNIFGAEGEISKEFSGNIDFNFNIKVHSASKKIDLVNFITGGSLKDQSQISIAPSAGLLVQLKVSANVKVPVRAMNIINYASTDSEYQEIEAGGKLDVKGNIFYQRNYIFNANKKQHFSQDSVIFNGLGGEYEYQVKVQDKVKRRKKNNSIHFNQEPKKFMLMEPYILLYGEVPLYSHPAQK